MGSWAGATALEIIRDLTRRASEGVEVFASVDVQPRLRVGFVWLKVKEQAVRVMNDPDDFEHESPHRLPDEEVRLAGSIIYTLLELMGSLILLGVILIALLIPATWNFLGVPVCIILMALGGALFLQLIVRVVDLACRLL